MTFHAGSRWFQSGRVYRSNKKKKKKIKEPRATLVQVIALDQRSSILYNSFVPNIYFFFSNNNWISVVERSSFLSLFFKKHFPDDKISDRHPRMGQLEFDSCCCNNNYYYCCCCCIIRNKIVAKSSPLFLKFARQPQRIEINSFK
jgi:hypothetical protein